MRKGSRTTTAHDVRGAFAAQTHAMVLADLAALDELLSDGFTLTQMTGTVQSKAAWLAEIEAASMEYHSVEIVDTAVEEHGERAVLSARTLTDATIWGTRAAWRLQLRLDFERHDGAWIARRSVASTW
jgi:hypothetical protein